jgi:hypothetical protein
MRHSSLAPFVVVLALAISGVTSASASDAVAADTAFPPLLWTSIGHGGGGAFQAIAAAPSQPDRVYTCIDVGGFYRSDNGGLTWREVYGGLKQFTHGAQRVLAIGIS